MIIGKGLLANTFQRAFGDDDQVCVFASGVSNSGETAPHAFLRERDMLETALLSGRRIIYFGTCSVYDEQMQDTPYARHKNAMEDLIRQCAQHIILRLPQVVGNTSNPHTLTNYLHAKILNGESFSVWANAARRLIDVDDVLAIAKFLLPPPGPTSLTVNVAPSQAVPMLEIVEIFERISKRKAIYSVVNAGSSYELDTLQATQAAASLGIKFDATYAQRVIRKYYG